MQQHPTPWYDSNCNPRRDKLSIPLILIYSLRVGKPQNVMDSIETTSSSLKRIHSAHPPLVILSLVDPKGHRLPKDCDLAITLRLPVAE